MRKKERGRKKENERETEREIEGLPYWLLFFNQKWHGNKKRLASMMCKQT